MTNRGRFLAFVLGAFAGVSTASPTLLAAQGAATGAIEGRVIETENSRPVAGAQIIVSGTAIRATTNDAGTFRIAGVPARQVELRFARLVCACNANGGRRRRANSGERLPRSSVSALSSTGRRHGRANRSR
jgi:hypothetical protein